MENFKRGKDPKKVMGIGRQNPYKPGDWFIYWSRGFRYGEPTYCLVTRVTEKTTWFKRLSFRGIEDDGLDEAPIDLSRAQKTYKNTTVISDGTLGVYDIYIPYRGNEDHFTLERHPEESKRISEMDKETPYIIDPERGQREPGYRYQLDTGI